MNRFFKHADGLLFINNQSIKLYEPIT